MSTLEKIKADRIAALKAGEGFRKDVISMILAGIKQVEVDTRKELTETDVIALLTKMAKQRQESINLYMHGDRLDLAEIETHEKAIIETYLPQQLDDTEVRKIVRAAIESTGATTIKDMGKVMGIVRPALIGKADMGRVSEFIKASLSV